MKKFIFTVLGISLIAAACNSQPSNPSPTPTPTPTPQSTPSNQTYESLYLKMTVASGWKATKVQSNPAAVNIIKDKYILYINANAGQASGVEGGRFAEIAMGAPSADAVVTVQPSEPCGVSEIHDSTANHPRVDLFVNPTDNKNAQWCAVPTNGKTVWYFSFIAGNDKGQGYFNYYKNNQPPGYVITMSYNSKDINSFPEKDSSGLNSALNEMTTMIKSLEFKQK